MRRQWASRPRGTRSVPHVTETQPSRCVETAFSARERECSHPAAAERRYATTGLQLSVRTGPSEGARCGADARRVRHRLRPSAADAVGRVGGDARPRVQRAPAALRAPPWLAHDSPAGYERIFHSLHWPPAALTRPLAHADKRASPLGSAPRCAARRPQHAAPWGGMHASANRLHVPFEGGGLDGARAPSPASHASALRDGACVPSRRPQTALAAFGAWPPLLPLLLLLLLSEPGCDADVPPPAFLITNGIAAQRAQPLTISMDGGSLSSVMFSADMMSGSLTYQDKTGIDNPNVNSFGTMRYLYGSTYSLWGGTPGTWCPYAGLDW